MNIKPLVAALAALSLTGAAFAANQAPAQARHTGTSAAGQSVLARALNGNSTAGYLHKNFVGTQASANQGFWLAGFGQLTAAYNNNALLAHGKGHGGFAPLPGTAMDKSSFTIALPHADVLFGYDSGHAGFVVDAGYSNMPTYSGGKITLANDNSIYANEAYMTYSINDMFGVKAGKFNDDFGSYDPTAAIVPLTAALSANNVTGVEGVFATSMNNGASVHASVAGATNAAATKASGGLTNQAKPTEIIINGGYDMPFKGATVGIQGSYDSKGAVDSVTTPTADDNYHAAWTAGAHYASGSLKVTADVLNFRTKTPKKTPWVWSGTVDYQLAKNTQHDMVVGGYGDLIKNGTSDMNGVHWILGAKFGYSLNSYATATAYLQRATMVDKNAKSNTTAMVALSVKV